MGAAFFVPGFGLWIRFFLGQIDKLSLEKLYIINENNLY